MNHPLAVTKTHTSVCLPPRKAGIVGVWHQPCQRQDSATGWISQCPAASVFSPHWAAPCSAPGLHTSCSFCLECCFPELRYPASSRHSWVSFSATSSKRPWSLREYLSHSFPHHQALSLAHTLMLPWFVVCFCFCLICVRLPTKMQLWLLVRWLCKPPILRTSVSSSGQYVSSEITMWTGLK